MILLYFGVPQRYVFMYDGWSYDLRKEGKRDPNELMNEDGWMDRQMDGWVDG